MGTGSSFEWPPNSCPHVLKNRGAFQGLFFLRSDVIAHGAVPCTAAQLASRTPVGLINSGLFVISVCF